MIVGQPDLTKLQTQLLVSGLQQKDNPLYQVINQLINATKQLQDNINGQLAQINDNITNITILINFANQSNRMFDFGDSDGGESEIIMINQGSSFSQTSGYWVPLTDDDVDETDLIFANADAIAVFVPTP